MNYARSHGLNIGSNPIKLTFDDHINVNIKTKPGIHIPFMLRIFDLFNNLIIDDEKYFSDIGLDMELYDNYDNPIDNEIYNIINNEIILEKGLMFVIIRIYITDPGKYKLKISIKNKISNLKNENSNTIELYIEVLDCDQSEIKIKDYINNFYTCEKPICIRCDTNKNFECLKSSNNTNNPKYNICQCIKGWKGKDCNELDFYDIK